MLNQPVLSLPLLNLPFPSFIKYSIPSQPVRLPVLSLPLHSLVQTHVITSPKRNTLLSLTKPTSLVRMIQ